MVKQRHCSKKLTKLCPGSRDPHLQLKFKTKAAQLLESLLPTCQEFMDTLECSRENAKRSVRDLYFKLNLTSKIVADIFLGCVVNNFPHRM